MTDAVPGPGRPRSATFPTRPWWRPTRPLRADAVAVLEGWAAPDAGAGAAAPRLPRPPRRPPRRRGEGRARRRTSRHPASCSTATGRAGAAHPAPPGERLVPVRRPPRGRGLLGVGGGPARGPRGVRASTPSSRSPSRCSSTGTGSWGPSAPAASTSTCATPPWRRRAPGPRVSAESHDVRWWPVDALPEGTARRARPAGVTRPATPSVSADPPVDRRCRRRPRRSSPSSSGGSPSAWASPSRKPRARSRRG